MRLGLWLLAASLALALFGCGKEKPAAETGPPPTVETPRLPPTETTTATNTIDTPALDGVKKANKPYKITLIVKTRNNPFFDPMIKAFEKQCKALGVVPTVQSPQQEGDSERQFALVQDETAKGADAILIAPADSAGIVPALKQAQDKGILVVNIDNRVDKAAAKSAGLDLGGYVGADNEAGGQLAGQEMIASIRPDSKVAVLEGIRGTDNAEARKRGFEGAVKGKLNVVATDSARWETQMAYDKTQAMLAAHPEITGLFCANDNMALGAIKAIREAGKKGKVLVVGYDNIPDVKQYLKSGEMHATIEQHPDLMGKYCALMAVGILNGTLPKGKEYLVPLEVIRQ